MGIAAAVGRVTEAPKLREEYKDVFPLGDRVVIAEDQAPKVSSGGIEIPDEAQKKPATGTVLAVGPEVGYEQATATQIKPGARVLYSKYSGTVVKVKGRRVLIIPERDVFAILGDGTFGEVDD